MNAAEAHPRLSADDVELLSHLAQGLTPLAIGRRLGLSERTIRRRTHSLCHRLGVAHSVQAVVIAVKHGLI